jgi:hypothetical protein
MNIWDYILEFFIDEKHPEYVRDGEKYKIKKSLKTGNVALLIGIIILIILLIHIF